MGCAFNCVIAPNAVQTEEELQRFYEETKTKLLEEYGEDFDGYTGDMAVDDGFLLVTELQLPHDGPEITQDTIGEHWDGLMELCGGHCEKWGPSIAVRIGGQWAICGAYSD
jgi:hypothetical protein